MGLLKKMNVDPVNVRPDICHQVRSLFSDLLKSLLALLDSPLNKAGHLQVCLSRALNSRCTYIQRRMC